MTTPVETHFSHNHEQPKSFQNSQPSPNKPPASTIFPVSNATRAGLTESEPATSPQSLAGETPKSPAESTRSRVRNLADKFESGRSSPAGSERAGSPIKTSFLPSQTMNQSRSVAADRLESFRPKLPGGWESSASLAPLVTPSRPEPSAAAIPLEQRLQDVVMQSGKPRAAAPGYTGNGYGNVRQEDPKSSQKRDEAPSGDPFASLAAAGSALAGAFSTAVGTDKDEDKHSPRGQQFPAEHQSDSTAAKGDPNVTRSRNTSMNTAFIPEASKPAMLTVPNDEASSIQPTPLDKLSQPAHPDQGKAADYFAGITTPKQQASGDSYMTQDSTSAKRLGLLPTLSTDATLQYESDRLHREIIRELSPRLTSEPSTAGSDFQYQDHPRYSANPSLNLQQRESLVIPREYDSYWNDSGSVQSSRASSVKGRSKAVRDATSLHAQDQSAVSPATSKSPTSGGEVQLVQDNFSERPSMPPHRFSWEGPSEAITPEPKLFHGKSPLCDSNARHGPFHDPQERTSVDSGASIDRQALHAPASGSYPGDASIPSDPIANDHRVIPQTQDPSFKNVTVASPSEPEPGLAPEYTTHDGPPVSVLGEPSSSISELGTRPDGGPFGHQNVQERNENLSQPTSNTDSLPPLPGPPATQPKTQSFREILALKEPKDRIEAYNEARAQLANFDTGLAHWLAVNLAELPEHKEVFPNGRLPGASNYKPSATRTKLGGLLPGSSVGQQTYHQQYLNASSSGGTAVEASNVPGGHTPQAYPPASSGKLSSQQMQARGKDLLHSAGVFGGKANVAAKGLFSKGRSKFRGGNADKAPISTFNTSHETGVQQQHQSSKSSPSTPQSESFPGVSNPHKQSTASRPKSFAAPLTYQTQDDSVREKQNHSQPSLRPFEWPSSSDTHNLRLSNDLDRLGVSGQPPFPKGSPQRDTAQNAHAAETAGRLDVSGNLSPATDQIQQGRQQSTQNRHVQSPHPLPSSNRTPTQADYVDYFRRGSSPTAMTPKARNVEDDQQAPEVQTASKPSIQSQRADPNSPPNLKAKYSVQAQREGRSVRANQTNPEPGHPQTDQAILQRGSEDSGGTFQIAGSGSRTHPAKAAIGLHQDVPGVDQDQPTEDLVREISSEDLPSPAPPVAVPAANIRDQPQARPFSFVQFSKSPTMRPFGDYPRREPSIDSTASRIDPDQDVPPSPISPRESVSSPRVDQPRRKSPVHHGVDHDFIAGNGQRSSGPGSQSYPQPFQGSNLQGYPAFHRGQSPNRGDEMLVQGNAAPVPRHETVIPRQQPTEYSLEGAGPAPAPRPTNSTSTSKRGSRSSAFFRSFKTPSTETTSPQIFDGSDGHDYIVSPEKSKIRKTKSKRGSLFRSRIGAGNNNSSEIHPEEANSVTTPANAQGAPQPATDMAERNENPAQLTSKYRNRLSKAATAKLEERQQQEPSRKNRLSAIGSLFGRSKAQKSSTAGLDHSQQMLQQDSKPPQEQTNPMSTPAKNPRGTTIPSEDNSRPDDPYQYTRNKLARGGLLTQNSMPRYSKTSESSAYSQDSMQRQQQFPPRHQSLGHRAQQNEQRQSNWSREPSSTSSNIRPQPNVAPTQQHRVQSSVTTRTTTYHSAPRQSDSKPRHFSTTTTATTTLRTPNTNPRHQSVGNNLPRSDSPPPPPPPPKDTWHQPKPHQRSTSNNSFAQAVRNSNDTPPQPNYNGSSRTAPQATNPTSPPSQLNYSNPLQPSQPRQSLPPLQTNIPSPSLPPLQPRGTSSTTSDSEARKSRQSQIESLDTPKAELPTAATSASVKGKEVVRTNEVDSDDEPIMMSATSFPGQEWQPGSFARWEGD